MAISAGTCNFFFFLVVELFTFKCHGGAFSVGFRIRDILVSIISGARKVEMSRN